MPVVTALRPRANARVAVELDHAPWRIVPGEAVLRAGLEVGHALDRGALRTLRRELRRAEAVDIAARTLRASDRSRQTVEARLTARGVTPAVREETVAMLERTGLVDDGRFARNRAEALAGRGYGDAAIRADLEHQGLAGELCEEVLAGVEPELDRAMAIAARRGNGPKTLRYLAAKGFSPDNAAQAAGIDFAPGP